MFIREIVPRRAIATVARLAYGERYERRPMRHLVRRDAGRLEARYEWRSGNNWGGLRVEASGEPRLPAEGSVEQFITEHYWGYAAQRNGGCVEYEVKHVPWRVWKCTSVTFDGYATDLYGDALARMLAWEPDSAFLAEGSRVHVLSGARLVWLKVAEFP